MKERLQLMKMRFEQLLSILARATELNKKGRLDLAKRLCGGARARGALAHPDQGLAAEIARACAVSEGGVVEPFRFRGPYAPHSVHAAPARTMHTLGMSR